jgi:hypothetical protein
MYPQGYAHAVAILLVVPISLTYQMNLEGFESHNSDNSGCPANPLSLFFIS